VIVRCATGADAAGIEALERLLFGVDAWSAPSVVAELSGEDRCCLVAVVDDELVGYTTGRLADDVVDLQRIGVRPTRQRRGVARLLLAELVERARSGGAERMLLEVGAGNAAALAFYAREGFAEVARRRRYYRDGDDALVLARALGRTGNPRRG
jgi:ribosomal-protein-alanine N-acetyltransferase